MSLLLQERENKYRRHFLGLIAILMVSLAAAWPKLPITVFVALSPLFALLEPPKQISARSGIKTYAIFLFYLLAAFLVGNLIKGQSDLLQASIAAILVSFSAPLYFFSYRYSKNGLGILTLVLFWLSLEYLMIKWSWLDSRFILANFIAERPGWWRWNIFTGYLGGSLWILVVNTIFYYAFFYKRSIIESSMRWLSLAYATMVVLLPLLLANFIKTKSFLNLQLVKLLYHSSSPVMPEGLEFYSRHGEYLGRTALWVSVLILVFAAVKRTTTHERI